MAAAAAAPSGEHIYATLLLSDSYLPGALVLAHSLRDGGTTKKLAALVTLDAVSADAITQLKTVYHHVLPVPRIRNQQPANLYLMDRLDLHSAFTKINLWKQTHFSKIVYIDADVVAYRAPDELFALPHAFSAAPDVGWPDLFNTGVMVLTPSMGDFYAMLAMAERGISFDGADQGLLNMHFARGFNRLPFTYNVTPSAHYQYLPAYRHFQSAISMVHFIGPHKPWHAGRNALGRNSPYDEMLGRWWAVHDRHYREQETPPQQAPSPPSREWRLGLAPTQTSPGGHGQQGHPSYGAEAMAHQPHHPVSESYHPQTSPGGHGQRGHPPHAAGAMAHQPPHPASQPYHRSSSPSSSRGSPPPRAPSGHPEAAASGLVDEARPEQATTIETRHTQAPPSQCNNEPLPVLTKTWDAQRQPPPLGSKPEAINFPSTHYEMSRDTNPFVPPARYPSPPKDMWYQVPSETPALPSNPPRPIFPWERSRPRPARAFADETPEMFSAAEASTNEPPPAEPDASMGSPSAQPVIVGHPAAKSRNQAQTPPTPTSVSVPLDPWTSFTRLNAWDDVPEIGRYIEGLQKHRRRKSQGAAGGPVGDLDPSGIAFAGRGSARPRSFKLTDFPSEAERPSLPVTPAPVRRGSYWGTGAPEPGDGAAGNQPFPEAEGVPVQSEWDAAEQLQKLAEQQSEALLRKLGGGGRSSEDPVSRKIPWTRPALASEAPGGLVDAPSAPPSVVDPQPVTKKASVASPARDVDNGDAPAAKEPMASASDCGSPAPGAKDSPAAGAAQ